jgi:hypothetical protein
LVDENAIDWEIWLLARILTAKCLECDRISELCDGSRIENEIIGGLKETQ